MTNLVEQGCLKISQAALFIFDVIDVLQTFEWLFSLSLR